VTLDRNEGGVQPKSAAEIIGGPGHAPGAAVVAIPGGGHAVIGGGVTGGPGGDRAVGVSTLPPAGKPPTVPEADGSQSSFARLTGGRGAPGARKCVLPLTRCTLSWESGGPSERAEHAAVSIGTHVLVFGGDVCAPPRPKASDAINDATHGCAGREPRVSDDVFVLNVAGQTWAQLPIVNPMRRSAHCMAVLDGTLYTMGGRSREPPTGRFHDEMMSLDFAENAEVVRQREAGRAAALSSSFDR